MSAEKPVRRLTLRQLLTQAEKTNRDLAELVHVQLMGAISDFRDLSRPVRRRSHYPMMVAVQNALRKLEETGEQSLHQVEYLLEHLEAIRDHGRREQATRK
ncbi:MAG: hypothetical protein K2X38_11580 [Gemmataceae bacterium]|nr:hypothetical protein [Gemmataceae bacterium]